MTERIRVFTGEDGQFYVATIAGNNEVTAPSEGYTRPHNAALEAHHRKWADPRNPLDDEWDVPGHARPDWLDDPTPGKAPAMSPEEMAKLEDDMGRP